MTKAQKKAQKKAARQAAKKAQQQATPSVTETKPSGKAPRGVVANAQRQWAPSLGTIRSYNWSGRGNIDVHTVGNKVLVVLPWFAYDYQISGGRVPPGVAVAEALHDHYADADDVIIVAYSSSKQTGINEVIQRRDTNVAFASCSEFKGPYRLHSERSSYSYGLIAIDRNGKIALSKSDYSSSEGNAQNEAKNYIKAIDYLRQEQRTAGVPSITPPTVNEVEERALRLTVKSLNGGVVGSNYKKIVDFLKKNPDHPEAGAVKETVDTWLLEQRAVLTELRDNGAVYEAAEFADAMAKVCRMSSLANEFTEANTLLRKDPAYKDGQKWNKTVEVLYRSPTEMRPKILDKYLEDVSNEYYRELATRLRGK